MSLFLTTHDESRYNTGMLNSRQEQVMVSVYTSLIDSRCHRQGYTIPQSDLESLAKLAVQAAKVFERVVTTKPKKLVEVEVDEESSEPADEEV